VSPFSYIVSAFPTSSTPRFSFSVAEPSHHGRAQADSSRFRDRKVRIVTSFICRVAQKHLKRQFQRGRCILAEEERRGQARTRNSFGERPHFVRSAYYSYPTICLVLVSSPTNLGMDDRLPKSAPWSTSNLQTTPRVSVSSTTLSKIFGYVFFTLFQHPFATAEVRHTPAATTDLCLLLNRSSLQNQACEFSVSSFLCCHFVLTGRKIIDPLSSLAVREVCGWFSSGHVKCRFDNSWPMLLLNGNL
jgi:hypothetical protein